MNKVVLFIKQAIEELKRTQWPSKKETTRLTLYVIGVSAGIGLYVSIADSVFKLLLTYLIK